MTQTAVETIRGVLTQIAPVPPGIDSARLVLWEQKGNFSYEQVRATLGAAIQSLNEERALVWSDLTALTTDAAIWYMNGGAVQPAEVTMGKSRPPLVFGNNAGHSIDLKVWSLGIGGDARTLEDMTEAQLVGSIIGLVTALRDAYDQQLLTRFFNNTDNLLGTNGYDVPFCNGSPLAGSGGPKYAPPKWNGKVFYEDHNHYIGVDTSVTNPATGQNYTIGDAVSQAATLIGEHGLPMNAYFRVLVSESDVDKIQTDIRYVLPVDNINEDKGGLTTGNIYFEQSAVGSTPASGGRYIGSVNTKYGFGRMYSIPRIPSGYLGVYRPGPAFGPNNALMVRYRKSTGYGVLLKEIPDFNTTFPIKEVDVEDEYGISCGTNRYAGACVQFGTGVSNYTNPVIS